MRARRVDGNLAEIAKAFEKLGCSVHRTNGDWDLTVGYGGLTQLVEVKDPKSARGKREIKSGGNANQQKFRATWTGGIRIVKDLGDVQNVVATLRNWHNDLCHEAFNFARFERK